VRENTEGFLADRNLYEGYGEFMPTADEVISLRVLTRKSSERIARFAFDLARKRQRKIITVAHKANVFRKGCGFFLGICREIAKDYPEVQLRDQYVDAVANNLIAKPEEYDVILTTNLFGDIVSDEAAALVSSLVPTANFGHEVAVFKPIHETMTKIAGTGTVNPISTILSAGMMLEWMGEKEAYQAMEKAVSSVLNEGKTLTRDLGGSSSTSEVVQAITKRIGA
jgi:3-isopropylmalate dehydrogenase